MVVKVQEEKGLAGVHMKYREYQHKYLMTKVFLQDKASTTSALEHREQKLMKRTDTG